MGGLRTPWLRVVQRWCVCLVQSDYPEREEPVADWRGARREIAMAWCNWIMILVLALAGSAPARAETGYEIAADVWLTSRLAGFVRPNAKVGDIDQSMTQLFHSNDVDGGGISETDYSLADQIRLAKERARELGRVLEKDLDGDGQITREEIAAIVRPEARQFIIVQGVRIAPTEAQVAEIVRQLTIKGLADDKNNDGVLSFEELQASITERVMKRFHTWNSMRNRVPMSLDRNGDGTVALEEYVAQVLTLLASVDTDRDGIISDREAAAFGASARVAQRAELEANRRAQDSLRMREIVKRCGFPKASGAHVVLVGTYAGTGLSDVSIGGGDVDIGAAKVSIEPGEGALFVVLTSHEAVVWQFAGAVERVKNVVVQSIRGTTSAGPRSGVVGVPRERVHFAPSVDCLRYFSSSKGSLPVQTAGQLRNLIDGVVHTTIGAFAIGDVKVPSGGVTVAATFESGRRTAVSGAGAPIWRVLKDYVASGLVSYEPADVVAAQKVDKANVLGHVAGLAQLLDSGALQLVNGGVAQFDLTAAASDQKASGKGTTLPREFRIVKPMRFPPGLSGAHRIKFLLKHGVPLPDGDAGQSCVLSEATGERLAGNGPC